MLRTIGRIAIILLAAALIAGGLYLLVNRTAQTGLANARGGRLENRAGVTQGSNANLDRQGNRGATFRPGGRGEGDSRFGFNPQHGLLDAAGKVTVVAVVIALVVLAQKLLGKSPGRRSLNSA
jgi:hypothetical protein